YITGPPPPQISTLSLHDALPIFRRSHCAVGERDAAGLACPLDGPNLILARARCGPLRREADAQIGDFLEQSRSPARGQAEHMARSEERRVGKGCRGRGSPEE